VGPAELCRRPHQIRLRAAGRYSTDRDLPRVARPTPRTSRLTVDQNIRFFGGVYGLSGERFAARRRFVLEMAGLTGRENQATRSLSGGWRQRLALGCAILHEPSIVFLDEPTGGVDPLSRRQFWDLIADLSQQGVTVLVTTHYLDEAEHCQRIAVIHAARLRAIGTTSELKGVFADRTIVEVHVSRPVEAMNVLDQLPNVEKTSLFGTAVHAVLRSKSTDGAEIGRRLRQAGIDVSMVNLVAPSLEDVFLDVVERAPR
jgi:ABC-2 type transport system ATP-binding protein